MKTTFIFWQIDLVTKRNLFSERKYNFHLQTDNKNEDKVQKTPLRLKHTIFVSRLFCLEQK